MKHASKNPKVRTRFAPSPTGYLHVGGLRTALFNYLFARHNEGVFVLRIEDTDRERYVAGAVEKILQTLKEVGLGYDEGPDKDGGFGPYIQSERLPQYQKYAADLISTGSAYYCFCTPSRLDKIREEQKRNNFPTRYDGNCRDLSQKEREKNFRAGTPFVVRFRTPRTGVTEFTDLVFGRKEFRNDLLDDTILTKSDGYPVYNFANVIDDHLMEISHVIRGEEFISSTPKHVLLYQSFGWGLPQFAHLPLLLDQHRKKLSKRSGDVAVEEYLLKGYLKEALLNFISLLGWNPKSKEEIFSLQELVAEFSLDHANKSGAIFDPAKLNFINRKWQQKLNLGRQDPLYVRAVQILQERLGQIDENTLVAVWPQILQRANDPYALEKDLEEFLFYFREPQVEISLLPWKKQSPDSVKARLTLLREYISTLQPADFEARILEQKIKKLLQSRGVPLGEALWPLRVALTGQKNSPGPFEVMESFGKVLRKNEVIVKRIDSALAILG
ncbi:MAG TPA: glutamate--tRNA ligase [Patescibacteria group bacterium]|nr:glutamate--tRNA ligase [Patescibacteria group bacterium]